MKLKLFYTSLKRIIISLITILSTIIFGTLFFEEIVLITVLGFTPLIIISYIVDYSYSNILKSIGGGLLEKKVPEYVNKISSFFEKAGVFLFGYSFDEYYKAFKLYYQNGHLPDINMNLLETIAFLMFSKIVVRVVYVVCLEVSRVVGAHNLGRNDLSK